MTRYIPRMMGLYRTEELLVHIKVDQLTCTSPDNYEKVYIEFSRGSHVQKSTPCVLKAGSDRHVIFNYTFN